MKLYSKAKNTRRKCTGKQYSFNNKATRFRKVMKTSRKCRVEKIVSKMELYFGKLWTLAKNTRWQKGTNNYTSEGYENLQNMHGGTVIVPGEQSRWCVGRWWKLAGNARWTICQKGNNIFVRIWWGMII